MQHRRREPTQAVDPSVLPVDGPGFNDQAIEFSSNDSLQRAVPGPVDSESRSATYPVLASDPPASIEDFCKYRVNLSAKAQEAAALGITSFQITPDRPVNIPTSRDGPLVITLTRIDDRGVESSQGRKPQSPLSKSFDVFLPGETIELTSSTLAQVTAVWINPLAADAIAELSNIENWKPLTSVRAASDKCVFRLFKPIERFTSSEDVASEEKAFYAATFLLSHVLRQYSVKASRAVSSPYSAKYPEIVESIKANIGATLLTSKLARQFGMRECELNDLFAAEAGCTPYQSIIKQRVELAAQMLRDPALSITSIAYDCGFGSHAHLTTTFKNRMGVTPSSFRKSYQQSEASGGQLSHLVDHAAERAAAPSSLSSASYADSIPAPPDFGSKPAPAANRGSRPQPAD